MANILRERQAIINRICRFGGEALLPVRIASFALLGFIIALTGPFGTYELPFAERAAYWVSWLAIIWFMTTVLFLCLHRMSSTIPYRSWFRDLACFVLSVPISAICAVYLARTFFPTMNFDLSTLVAEATFLSPFMVGIIGLLHLTQSTTVPKLSDQHQSENLTFLDRLPANLGRDLVRISVTDHYLDVHTASGKTSIHGSLSNACNELTGYDGIRIHRAHWVATLAVEKRVWRDSSLVLQLRNGDLVPVGRSYRKIVLAKIKRT